MKILLKSGSVGVYHRIQEARQILENIMQRISNVIESKLQNKWPHLALEVFDGAALAATWKSNPQLYFYSQNVDSTGRLCGKKHSVNFKVPFQDEFYSN